MLPSRAQVVCLAVGNASEEYVIRLESMLRRHMPVPFDLACAVDRPLALPASIAQIDLSGSEPPRSGMRMTTYKLALYDRNRFPFDEFLYLDTSLVICRDMTPLLDFAYDCPTELIAVDDWNYDAYNTCVMRIRPGGVLAEIPKAYAEGVTYAQKHPGDQDFVTGFLHDRGLEAHIATWPKPLVASYKAARKLTKSDPEAAKRQLDEAVIVKFHGEPKMHQLLDPRYRLKEAVRKLRPWHPNAWFWIKELRQHWR